MLTFSPYFCALVYSTLELKYTLVRMSPFYELLSILPLIVGVIQPSVLRDEWGTGGFGWGKKG